MPPEQAGTSREITAAADVYGLGATLYALLTGRAPFLGDSLPAVVKQVLDDEPPRPRSLRADVPPDLEAICLKCLEKSPARRYSTAQALADDLARWQAGQATLARPQSWLERPARRMRRRWRTCVAVAAAAACLAVLAAIWPREPDPLAPINAALTAGRPVTLLGPTGGPAWQRWMFGTGTLSDPAAKTPFLVSCQSDGYLELVPRTFLTSYRLTLEYRMDNMSGYSWAGLYLGRNTGPAGPSGSIDRALTIAFREDLVNDQPVHPSRGNPLVVNDELFISMPQHPKLGPGSPVGNLFIGAEHMAGDKHNRPWRRIEVEVRPETVHVRFALDAAGPWQDINPTPIEARRLMVVSPQRRAWLNRNYAGLEIADLGCDPAGGCGLIVINARVFFRNFRIEPLD
jgi:serine/threonine-protein kinase